MSQYRYRLPPDLGAAAAAFDNAEAPAFLAGGMSLLPVIKQRLAAPTDLIDLGGIPGMNAITTAAEHVTVGAMTRHADVARSDDLRHHLPVLADLAGTIGDPQVRNRGTMGGSVANADPAADYPCAVLGLDATILTDRREIAGDEYFIDLFETALEPGEIITAIRFRKPLAAAYEKFRQPASRFALVGVMVARYAGGVRVAVTGAGPCAFRLPEIEALLAGNFSAAAVPCPVTPPVSLNDDFHADPEYRAHLIGVLARRCVSRIIEDQSTAKETP